MNKSIFLPVLSLFLLFIVSCDKRDEKAMKISGIWDLEETTVTIYSNNEPISDSIVEQTGQIQFTVTGGLDNPCEHNINYAPCIDYCHWDFPKKKEDQLFFYYHDGNTSSIYSGSCMVRSLSKKKLELMVVSYDNELNIQQKTIWKFKRAKL